MRKLSGEFRDLAIDNTKKSLRVHTPMHLVSRLMSIFGLCLAAIFVIRGEMTVGTLTIFNTLIFSLHFQQTGKVFVHSWVLFHKVLGYFAKP